MNEERDFGEALFALKNGHAVARKGWNSKGVFLMVQPPDAQIRIMQPHLWIISPYGFRVWVPTHTDLLAEDWLLVERR
jgi:hypothetical protein